VFAGVLLLFIFVLELGVAFLQAYVFITLVCIYFNDSLNLAH
jgi:F0F1-type ATP synthase membrane subunit a